MPQPHARRLLRVQIGEVDLHEGILRKDSGDTIHLTPKETALLAWLAARPGQVVDRATLLTEVWGYAPGVVSRAVDKTMSRLRAKLERTPASPTHLQGIAGEGYRYSPLDAAPASDGPRLHGRDALLLELRHALQSSPGARVLHGPGGVGKTTLSRALLDRHPSGGRFADLSACTDGAEARAAVRAALGAEAPHGHAAAARALQDGLLVLDNVEQITEAAAVLVQELLDAAPRLRILLTSRITLPFTPQVHHIAVGPLDAEAGRALLVERGGLDAAEVDPAVADAIVAELDGLPLALELAAARLDICTLADLLQRLPRRLHLLRTRDAGRPPRQQSLEAAIQWSWELLDDHEQAVLACCSVFVGGFDLAAAEAVLGELEALDTLPVLARASLVHRLPGHTAARFHLHHSIAAFARRHHIHANARDRHLAWFSEQAPAWAAAIHGRSSARAWERLVRERDNLQAAFAHAVATENAAAAVAVATALQPLLRTRGPIDRWTALTDTSVRLAATADPATIAVAHELRGVRRLASGDLDGADDDLTIAHSHAEHAPEAAGMAAVRLAFVRDLLGRPGSDALLEQAHAIGIRHGLPRLRAVAHGDRGIHAWRHGHFAEAERAFAEGDRLFARAGDVVQRASTAVNRAHNARAQGLEAAATVHLLSALRLAEACGYRRVSAVARLELGDLALLSGDLDAADTHLQAARSHGEVLGSDELMGVADVRRACVDLARGQPALPRLRTGLDRLAGVDSQAAEGGWLGLALLSRLVHGEDARRGHLELAVAAAAATDGVRAHLRRPDRALPQAHLDRADLARWRWVCSRTH